jgi:hypothetical protein
MFLKKHARRPLPVPSRVAHKEINLSAKNKQKKLAEQAAGAYQQCWRQ